MNATLLVVDDDPRNRDAFSRRLIRTGFTVLTAESGSLAMEMVSAHRVDAVLLDAMMPGMSGIETLRRLRESRPASDLPVIMVTANDRSEDVVEALNLGANDYVTKPIDFPVAVARIRTHVSARRADPLTGLPNRVQFIDKVETLLAQQGVEFALLFIDVDRFKGVNDSFGHLAGDELLIGIARRLEQSLRATDTVAGPDIRSTVARLGGDEFTILLEGISSAEQALAVADRLLATLAQPFDMQGRDVFTSVSIGVALSGGQYQSAEELIRDADTAMYEAKARGAGRCEVFDASMLAATERRRQIASDLRHALDRQELHVYYQPIVSMADDRLTGFEALVRWHHPERGVILPAEFIGVAERTGLIVPIGLWVLREACRQMRAWDAEYSASAGVSISVNLSARQCVEPHLVAQIADILRETGLAPGRLKLEITESAVLADSDVVEQALGDLRGLGVHLGLDDFGTGYSALAYLQRFAFNTIKIDRAFVSRIHEGGNAEIIRAIISMAQGLSMDVTAEGVETAAQLSALKDLSCGAVQGFYFSKPLTATDAAAVLGEKDPHRSA
jgi:diguanylate cyclase (GGDEF)-like protein